MSSSSPKLQIQEKRFCSGQNEVLLNPLSSEDKATTTLPAGCLSQSLTFIVSIHYPENGLKWALNRVGRHKVTLCPKAVKEEDLEEDLRQSVQSFFFFLTVFFFFSGISSYWKLFQSIISKHSCCHCLAGNHFHLRPIFML